MSKYTAQLSIPPDDDGFVSFNCPQCKERFKLAVDEVQDDSVSDLHCPICGLSNEKGYFISDEAREAATEMAKNLARQMINDAMKDFGKGFKNIKNVSYKPGPPIKMEPERTLIEDIDLEAVELPCCHKSVKIRQLDQGAGLYCPYCGLAI